MRPNLLLLLLLLWLRRRCMLLRLLLLQRQWQGQLLRMHLRLLFRLLLLLQPSRALVP